MCVCVLASQCGHQRRCLFGGDPVSGPETPARCRWPEWKVRPIRVRRKVSPPSRLAEGGAAWPRCSPNFHILLTVRQGWLPVAITPVMPPPKPAPRGNVEPSPAGAGDRCLDRAFAQVRGPSFPVQPCAAFSKGDSALRVTFPEVLCEVGALVLGGIGSVKDIPKNLLNDSCFSYLGTASEE